jgi:putative membrane protein
MMRFDLHGSCLLEQVNKKLFSNKMQRMKKIFVATSVLALFLVACDKDDDNKINSTDQEFVRMASISNNAEIMTGQLAATKGTAPMVKSFGAHMVMEHGLAQNDLKSRASEVGINVSDTVDAEHRTLMTYLNTLSGYSFDTAYINSQLRDHQKTITIFQMEIDGGQHQRIRSYANEYLPHIQMHYNRADSIRKAF